jgi:hypothetical protein
MCRVPGRGLLDEISPGASSPAEPLEVEVDEVDEDEDEDAPTV